ncbi:MAG TPA: ROK family protein [Polyangiaceae bacterium]|nr:ROK family protein [Polyangiaceae bacterium]
MLIGVDFGGTQVKAGIVEGGEVVRSTSAATQASSSPAEILDLLADTVLALAPQPESVGVAIPGEVDADGKCWRLTNVPGFAGVHIASELSRRLGGCPIAVENDATSAALGERLYGHGREHPSFLMVTLGTGIGGGLVLGHMLYPGANGFAAEFGHINVDRSPEAPLCACGQHGCVEAFAGTKALVRRYEELSGEKVLEVLPISVSARRGESAGLEVFAMMGEGLGRGLAMVQNLLDLNAIVFSGGISASLDLIEPHVRRALRAYTFAPPLAEVPLLVSGLGERAGIIGAAYLTTL